ncbi:MAG: hypothetical protein HY777_10195 [Betaproteobacteria bacterium]|nr:hypothetical protein [Betaproteobacteria bacterium]
MGTMNFSVPDDVKERFNRTFADKNKSAIVTQLLEEAVARAERKRQSDDAIKRILLRRQAAPGVSKKEILRQLDEIRAQSDASHGIPPR